MEPESKRLRTSAVEEDEVDRIKYLADLRRRNDERRRAEEHKSSCGSVATLHVYKRNMQDNDGASHHSCSEEAEDSANLIADSPERHAQAAFASPTTQPGVGDSSLISHRMRTLSMPERAPLLEPNDQQYSEQTTGPVREKQGALGLLAACCEAGQADSPHSTSGERLLRAGGESPTPTAIEADDVEDKEMEKEQQHGEEESAVQVESAENLPAIGSTVALHFVSPIDSEIYSIPGEVVAHTPVGFSARPLHDDGGDQYENSIECTLEGRNPHPSSETAFQEWYPQVFASPGELVRHVLDSARAHCRRVNFDSCCDNLLVAARVRSAGVAFDITVGKPGHHRRPRKKEDLRPRISSFSIAGRKLSRESLNKSQLEAAISQLTPVANAVVSDATDVSSVSSMNAMGTDAIMERALSQMPSSSRLLDTGSRPLVLAEMIHSAVTPSALDRGGNGGRASSDGQPRSGGKMLLVAAANSFADSLPADAILDVVTGENKGKRRRPQPAAASCTQARASAAQSSTAKVNEKKSNESDSQWEAGPADESDAEEDRPLTDRLDALRALKRAGRHARPDKLAVESPEAVNVPATFASSKDAASRAQHSMAEVDKMLAQLELTQYSAAFEEHGYDDADHILNYMSAKGLEELICRVGMKCGHAAKFCDFVHKERPIGI